MTVFVILVLWAPAVHAETADFSDRARAMLLVEADHGGVLLAKSPALEMPIASLTKLMTVLVFLDSHPRWDQIMTIRQQDIRSSGRGILVAGDRIRLKDLFTLALIRSDNTAAESLVAASGMAEQEFVAAMNAKAERLGLVETSFVEPTGLSPENRSTARDVVRLAHVAFVDSTIAGVLRRQTASIPVLPKGQTKRWVAKRIYSTNALLGKRAKDFQVLEGKTGTTDEAGYSFVVHAQTVGSPERHLFAVILAATSASERFHLALDLLQFGTAQLTQLPQEEPSHTALQSAMSP